MIFEPGTLRDSYPLRQTTPSDATSEKHSLKYTDADIEKLQRLYVESTEQLKQDASLIQRHTERQYDAPAQRMHLAMVAKEFARYSSVYSDLHQQDIGNSHLQSAFGLLHRQVVETPLRSDRILTAGMAAVVLACSGMKVHIIVGNDLAFPYLKRILIPVFEALGYSAGFIKNGDDEGMHRAAYKHDVTIVSARECAMDFLRDAVKWPQRGNKILRKVDHLLGEKSRQQTNLMQGLPCAIFLDIDSALIDNARAPIVLTKNAHPMHEVEELKQALEMVEHLQNGLHFILTGDGAELAFSEEGKLQLNAWAEQLAGNWQIQHIAELMLAVAIVVQHLIKDGTHYRIRRNSVEWLVEDSLVPGMEFYSKPFLTRVVELRDECDVKSQREVAARASYQQIFNRYIHLCGLCHSSQLIESELLKIYGLRYDDSGSVNSSESGSGSKLRSHSDEEIAASTFDQVHILKNNDEKLIWLKSYLAGSTAHTATLLVASDIEMLGQLGTELESDSIAFIRVDPSQETAIAKILQPGCIVLSLSESAEHLFFNQPESVCHSLKIIVAQRSKSRSADLRNLFWLRELDFDDCETILLLAEDDELFTEIGVNPLQNMLRFFAEKKVGLDHEKLIRKAQVHEGRGMYKVRLGLLNHDTTMHDLLSFSGRGLYE